jgi:hypothetical protein
MIRPVFITVLPVGTLPVRLTRRTREWDTSVWPSLTLSPLTMLSTPGDRRSAPIARDW